MPIISNSSKKGINFDLYLPRQHTEPLEGSYTEVHTAAVSSRLIHPDGSMRSLGMTNAFRSLRNSTIALLDSNPDSQRVINHKKGVNFDKSTPREDCFQPNTLTKNVSYHPDYRQIEKKRTANLTFSKMTGRIIADNSHRKRECASPNYEVVVPQKYFLIIRRLYKSILLDKALPRSPDPESKLPSWMQKGVYLRGMPNEKFFQTQS